MERTIIITGAAAGIGQGIATAFAKKAYHLVLVDRNQKQVEETKDQLLALYPHLTIQIIATDLTTEEGRTKLFHLVSETDVLINNIGYYENVDFFELQEEDWQKMINLNFIISMQLSVKVNNLSF